MGWREKLEHRVIDNIKDWTLDNRGLKSDKENGNVKSKTKTQAIKVA